VAGAGGAVMETGVPNLDAVLGGGLRRGCVAMILGAPGAGKTILSQQIAFHQARGGDRVLYLTGYSETHDKLLAYDHAMEFFDASLIGDRIQLLSVTDLLRRSVEEAGEAIFRTARTRRVRLVILDGFASMRRLLPDPNVAAEFIYTLGAQLAALGATLIVVVEGDPDGLSTTAELTVADVVLTLRQTRRGTWDRRQLHVLKVRGAASLNGVHPFTIGGRGVHVHPRFESVVPRTSARHSDERAAFGVAQLDEHLRGGLTVGTATLVAGSPGTGKTLLGLHLLAEGARRGEAGVYVGFLESADQLRAKARTFGIDLAGAEERGRVRLLIYPGYDIDADRVAEDLCADVEARQVRRLVVDSAIELERAIFTDERKPNFLAALVDYVRGRGMTGYLALDVPKIIGPELDLTGSPLAVFAENLILLRQTELRGAMHRILTVLKMRFSDYDPTIVQYAIRAGAGIEVIGPAPAAEGLLTGVARPLPGRRRVRTTGGGQEG
jgi:circadian clock protein KaiC